jgi:hypothetical protein
MEDPPNQLHNWTPISSKIQTTITLLRESGNVPESFYIPYFKTLSVKRLLINPPQDLVIILKQNYVRYIK